MNENPVIPRIKMESSSHRSIRIFTTQVTNIQRMLDYAHPDAETHILRKYGVRDLDELWALDYEDIKAEVSKFIGKKVTS